ncbi:MAG: HAMP domain-containing protein, partial [Acidimicrobiales bacterium]
MRRRLTLTIVGLVAAALVVAGLGTLVLGRVAARGETLRDLENQAAALSRLTDGLQQRPVLNALRRSLRLEGAAIIPIPLPDRAGVGLRRPRVVAPAAAAAEPVGGITLREEDFDLLRTGSVVVSGWRGDVAYAAAPVNHPGAIRFAVLLTRKQSSGLGTALPWFLLSAGAALVVAAVAADRLARRFARPVSATAEAARRIAAGDLAVRVDPAAPGAEAELARLAESINAMAAELERARGLERQFLLSVSHELRTP